MNAAAFFAAMEATWPCADSHRLGPWRIRAGAGGGKRVSAATAEAECGTGDVAAAEAAMAALGQPALFLIRDGEADLDSMLAGLGYRVVDPVVGYAMALAGRGEAPCDPMAAFAHWPPLAIAVQLWAEAGIGPGRLAVMARAPGPCVAILARAQDRPTGVGFVAISGRTAMLHALEVTPDQRRKGAGRNILRHAAAWAQDHGAETLALAVTAANGPARSLYAACGMSVVAQYHYREK